MLWVVENPSRFVQERAAISDLAGEAPWLQGTRWGFTEDALIKVDVDIVVGEETRDVELVFPNLFPDTPAYVRPRSSTARWSVHQYQGGVLCLEWGPDNWSPAITGADLLRSTYKLLSQEQGSSAGATALPSRHKLTFGQEVRADFRRIVVTPALAEFLRNLAPQSERTVTTRSALHDSTIVAFVSKVSQPESEPFQPLDTPLGNLECGPLFLWTKEGLLFKSATFSACNRLVTNEELLAAIHEAGFKNFKFPAPAQDESRSTEHLFLLVNREGHARVLNVTTGGAQSIKEYTVVDAGGPWAERRPAEHHALSEKRVGIVGLGSVGSKVAVSLARSGIHKFLLVDDDVMLPSNVCRHELDWTYVGVNKVDAVKEALSLVAAGIDVRVRRIRIAGQESSESASTALDALAACDLLIDATANPAVFVQLAAIAKRKQKNLMWGEVFAGGIGALLIRSRPGKDPDALAMRAGVYEHMQTFPDAPFRSAAGYDVIDDPTPLLAFDAEVSQFAGMIASFAIDTLFDLAESNYPYSAYLIGFKPGWIFDAPFDTRPILVEMPAAGAAEHATDDIEESRKQAVAVLVELLGQQANADSSTTS
jgi:molybdopterin/thiamine biosynthesis adenylyltransferase